MAETKDFGRLFFHLARFNSEDRVPLLGLLPSQELDPPYRRSTSVMLRVPRTPFGIVVGWWRATSYGEEQALLAATSGWGMDYDDLGEAHPQVKAAIRAHIADHASDLDEEWTVISMMGLDS